AALGAFIQSNVTGPPLDFSIENTLFEAKTAADPIQQKEIKKKLAESLVVDGAAPYRLAPHLALFGLAKVILISPSIIAHVPSSNWLRLRTNFIHQRLLSEKAISLQSALFEDIKNVQSHLSSTTANASNTDIKAAFLLEKAAIEIYHDQDQEARKTLVEAVKERHFEFALTGLLGKRTKFQQRETSQLVVLARSAGDKPVHEKDSKEAVPKALDLNDDTLLESISFSDKKISPEFQEEDGLAQSLKEGDTEKQPLESLDAIILLLTAASITNTSPNDGLTREETAPYAIRVIEGGSSNWQVYTQALLLRSRVEGYKSRTVERGLLQLQALVDQVIAETTVSADATQPSVTTFLPRPTTDEESASPAERLQYVFQLASPTRWELEAELAARWVNLGGLKTALEIYERLEMWPEVALCWAGIERDDKARQIIRRQLFLATGGDDSVVDDTEKWEGKERDPLPLDAPRLYCILGDLDKDPAMYERAWVISKSRYHRAQRSLGRYWFGLREYAKAVLAFSKAVKVRQVDHATWFAMGCALLELDQFSKAVEVFTRAVQLDNEDAESWSNLAVALLNLDPNDHPKTDSIPPPTDDSTDTDETTNPTSTDIDPQRHIRDALNALKQAAKLKRENFRIWSNMLTVSATLRPPSYPDIISAQQRIIDLRGNADGEKCLDIQILRLLVDHLTGVPYATADTSRPGLSRSVCTLFDRSITPLITASADLWALVAHLALWRDKLTSALEAREKAWRATTVQPGWEFGTEEQWNAVVDATLTLVEAYRELGPRERTEGLSAGSGELVMKDWKFKARSAVRGIMGRGKGAWEDTEGWERLKNAGEDLRG
ncbi:TPR-like protein, partial [Microthyrium microscopicum]